MLTFSASSDGLGTSTDLRRGSSTLKVAGRFGSDPPPALPVSRG
jgi:hypothetical protein